MAAGSFNFSGNADESNDENMVFLNNTDVEEQYTEEFERAWAAGYKPDADSEDCGQY